MSQLKEAKIVIAQLKIDLAKREMEKIKGQMRYAGIEKSNKLLIDFQSWLKDKTEHEKRLNDIMTGNEYAGLLLPRKLDFWEYFEFLDFHKLSPEQFEEKASVRFKWKEPDGLVDIFQTDVPSITVESAIKNCKVYININEEN